MRRRTRGESAITALLERVDPHSRRYELLVAARDFKASWVLLGERLTEVREKQEYLQWGHASFEAYCRRELRIKPETANKLTRSFAFLRDHEPTVLSEDTARELPPLDVIDLMSRARDRGNISDRDMQQVHHDVFAGEEGPPSRSELLKRFRELDPETFAAPSRPRVVGNADLKKVLLIAERLEFYLQQLPDASASAQKNAQAIVEELRDLFSTSQQKSA